MPFSGPDDAKLPSNVKKLGHAERADWVKAWNSAFKNCRDPKIGGQGSVEKCEATAFKIANSTIKKEAVVEELETKEPTANTKGLVPDTTGPVANTKATDGDTPTPFANTSTPELTIAEKMHLGDSAGPVPVAVVEVPWTPFGGAQTFEELDEFVNAQEQAWQVKKVTFATEDLISNVMKDEDVENRPNKIRKIVDGMEERLSQALAAVAKAIAPRPNAAEPQAETEATPDLAMKSFQILKAKDGSLRWIGFPSNQWRDRDTPAQIISKAAHEEFVDHLDKTKDFPVLMSWHTPGTEIGRADFADFMDGFLVMGGPIDPGKELEAERLAEKCQVEDIGMSHGFVYTYSDKAKEIIGHYRMWEVSHLPIDRAANVWTTIGILSKEVSQMKGFTPEKRTYLVGLHGEEAVVLLEGKAADLEKDLLTAGVDFKALSGDEPVEAKVAETVAPADAEATPNADVVAGAVKAIVESPGFKALIETVGTLKTDMDTFKTAVTSATSTAEKAEVKATDAQTAAQKTVDELISNAFISASSAHVPSRDAPAVKEDEAAALGGPTDESSGFQPGVLGGMFGAPAQGAESIPAASA